MTTEHFYIAIDRDYKGTEGGAGYNRLSLWKVPEYNLAKFYIEKTLKFIFENEYPTIRDWYSENECHIDYPLLITNDKKLYQVYRNVLSLEEFKIYCNGEIEKRALLDIHKIHPKINIYKGIMFKSFVLDNYNGSSEKIMKVVEDLITNEFVGAKNFAPNYTDYDSSNGESYDTYKPDLLGKIEFINDSYFINNLINDFNNDNKSL
ncbi:hypothetical protein LNP04_09560 [Chryseobacterium sp. C-71]|uniref:hypothetical protein n=1 Tax=Chryseobacterium sp. C-71 TaxID=2893882 RepID=UPI001E298411|nr:hypothetical protein [Chryseobacterium sp. C-71]UFH33923.1 hypothetical protein LNP04_09560 [Chryseobacterium sp. C-71]